MTGPDRGGDHGGVPGRPERKPAVAPVFLERQSYRRRRLMDAARLLPFVGAVLFAVPLLWPGAEAGAGAGKVPTSSAILYIFLVWAALILASALFGRMARGWIGADGARDAGEG